MREFTRLFSNPARALLILLWGSLCMLIFAAPLLAASARHPILTAISYLFFAPVCHQGPDRSFLIAGHAAAVCHRCTGIYLGLFLVPIVPLDYSRLLASKTRRSILVLASIAPLLLDVSLSWFGIWTNSPASRLATGMAFGAMLSALVAAGVEELIGGTWSGLLHLQASNSRGGIP